MQENTQENLAKREEMYEQACASVLPKFLRRRLKLNKVFIKKMIPGVLAQYFNLLNQHPELKVKATEFVRLTHIVEILCEFHVNNTNGLKEEKTQKLEADENYNKKLASDCGRAIFFVEHVSDESGHGIGRYSPLIVFPSMLYNYLISVLKKLDSLNTFQTEKAKVQNELFQYLLLQLRSVMNLLNINIKDAVCLWRNLHETECIATIISRNNEEVSKEFTYFQKFAFIDDFESDKPEVVEINEIYYDFKKNYREMKATRNEFCEKGWLRLADGFNASNGFNFKRGLQPMAGLEDRYQAFRSASRIVHPSSVTLKFNQISAFNFAYDQILHTTQNILNQISELVGEDKPENFNIEVNTLFRVSVAYFKAFQETTINRA